MHAFTIHAHAVYTFCGYFIPCILFFYAFFFSNFFFFFIYSTLTTTYTIQHPIHQSITYYPLSIIHSTVCNFHQLQPLSNPPFDSHLHPCNLLSLFLLHPPCFSSLSIHFLCVHLAPKSRSLHSTLVLTTPYHLTFCPFLQQEFSTPFRRIQHTVL